MIGSRLPCLPSEQLSIGLATPSISEVHRSTQQEPRSRPAAWCK
jgi:hypothetical protein